MLLLVPLLEIVGVSAGHSGVAGVVEGIRRWLGLAGLSLTLGTVLVLFVAVNVAQALLQRAQTHQRAIIEHRFKHALRCRLYRAMVNAQWAYLATIRSARFSHALTGELDRVGSSTQSFVALCSQIVLALIYVALAVRVSAPMTAVALAAGALLVTVLWSTVHSARLSGESLSRSAGDVHSTVLEHLGTLKATKSIGAEDRNYDVFEAHSRDLMKVAVTTYDSFANVTAAFSIGSVLILSSVLYLAVRLIGLSGAEILLLIFVFARLVPRFSAIQQSLQIFLTGLPAYERVLQLTRSAGAAAEVAGGAQTRISIGSGIQLSDVRFRYEAAAAEAVRGVTFAIPGGRTTALLGPSGAGKTTVADLVMGLLLPTSGEVLVNGEALCPDVRSDWRRQIGYVAQDAVLFHDTVRANLAWAAPAATEADMWNALEQAAAAEFVRSLPHGLDTEAGERGRRFSGGERQRLALAQTLLRRPELLVLDEATSALDVENEQRIQSAIERLHGSTTILLITHRLSMLRHVDLIHIFSGGSLLRSGSWESLVGAEQDPLRLLSGVEV